MVQLVQKLVCQVRSQSVLVTLASTAGLYEHTNGFDSNTVVSEIKLGTVCDMFSLCKSEIKRTEMGEDKLNAS